MTEPVSPLQFSFRPLEERDHERMHRWLNEPGVVRWWEGDDVSMPAIIADYGPDRDDQTTENWIAEIDGEAVGWICCWPVTEGLADEVEPWFPLGVEQTAAGIDYLVAAPERRGQGVGSQMIRAFTNDIVFARHPSWTQAAASPFTANVASCRALEKAGFEFAGSVQYDHDPDHDPADDPDEGPCSLMILNRPGSLM